MDSRSPFRLEPSKYIARVMNCQAQFCLRLDIMLKKTLKNQSRQRQNEFKTEREGVLGRNLHRAPNEVRPALHYVMVLSQAPLQFGGPVGGVFSHFGQVLSSHGTHTFKISYVFLALLI